MAVQKFSQINQLPPTSPSDEIVGVIGGTTDARYKISQIGTIPLAADLSIFLSPSGSDSNTGLAIGSPFATMSKSLSILSSYNYNETFRFFINIADGTYTERFGGAWILPSLVNAPITCGNILGNDANPGNVVFSFAGGFTQQGQYQTAITGIRQIGDPGGMSFFNAVIGGGNVSGGEGAGIIHGNVIIDTTNQSNCNFFTAQGGAVIDSIEFNPPNPGGIVVQGSNGGSFARATSGGIVNIDCDFVIFPASYNFIFSTVLTQFGAPEIVWAPGSTTNQGGVTGDAIDAEKFASILTFTGQASDIPGPVSGSGGTDGSIYWQSINTGVKGFSSERQPAPPAATDLPPQTYAVFKDTIGGGVVLAYNDAGTIKKVALV